MSHEVAHATVDVVLFDLEINQHEVAHATVDVVLVDPASGPAPGWIPVYLKTAWGWLPMFNPAGTPHDP